MRIVVVNWARFEDGASNGGGVNGYCRQLAIKLVKSGHRVAWLHSGLHYVGRPGADPPPRCEVRAMPSQQFGKGTSGEGEIEVFEVINSPVIAPGIFQASQPGGEISAPELEAELSRFFNHWTPDIVHFHNIEGFSAGCGGVAKASGAMVLYSLHNYHTVCPQVYLMQGGVIPCYDYDNGHACVGCIAQLGMPEPSGEKRVRAGLDRELPPSSEVAAIEPEAPEPPAPSAAPALPGRKTLPARAAGRLRRAWSVLANTSLPSPSPYLLPPVPAAGVPPFPGRPIGHVQPLAPKGSIGEADGQVCVPDLHRPLDNRLPQLGSNHRTLNEYGQRREAMISMLNACDCVIAVSTFVEQMFQRLGVKPGVMERMPVGTGMVELARGHVGMKLLRAAAARGEPICGDPTRVRLAFIGYNNYYKGLPMLMDSLDLLNCEQLAAIELYVWAKDVEPARARLMGLGGRLGAVHVHDGYKYEEIPAMLCGMDAGIVPSVWWDNGPQTVLEYLACGVPVIGAAVGGVVDILRDGVNGLLFRANDRASLAGVLGEVATQPAAVRAMRRSLLSDEMRTGGCASVQTMEEHASAMCAIYRRLCVKSVGGRAESEAS